MKKKHGFKDKTMNFFKLQLYDWNVNDAIKYYKQDKFCLDYGVSKNDHKYGCNKWLLCSYEHSINLQDLVYGDSQTQRDYKHGELLCLYLMYKNVYNGNNAELFGKYAAILLKTGKSQQDYIKSEMYFLKALAIDINNGYTHNNYGVLLQYRLHNNTKAEYHYKQALQFNRHADYACHANFASLLIDRRQGYELALTHSEKACRLNRNCSHAHYAKAKSLYFLNKFDLSLKEYQTCLKLNEKEAKLFSNQVKEAKERIRVLTNQIYQASTKKENDEKAKETNEDIMSEFNKLSTNDGINEIMAQIMQVTEMIDDTSAKNHLSIVQNKLENTRIKCTNHGNYNTIAKLQSNNSKNKSHKLTNPYIIIIGIEKYTATDKWLCNLDGVKQDVLNMIGLWRDIYGYKNMSVICSFNDTDKQGNMIIDKIVQKYGHYFPQKKTSDEILSDKKAFEDYLIKIRGKIEFKEENDGLILCYSGHGKLGNIILSNGKSCPIKECIIDVFNGKHCVHLRGKPKIAIFDCCCGNDVAESYQVKDDEKQNDALYKLRGRSEDPDKFNHSHSDIGIIFGNYPGFVIQESQHGGCLTRAIYKIFQTPKLIDNQSLRDLIIDIRKQTKINAGKGNKEMKWSAQMVDFHETLEKRVYFECNHHTS